MLTDCLSWPCRRAPPLCGLLLPLLLGSSAAYAQDAAEPTRSPSEIEDFLATLEEGGVELDLERQSVQVSGAVLRRRASPDMPLEFLMVTEGGFTHESLAQVTCKPSLLNAAFLALGLQPGHSRIPRMKEPPPSEEDVRDGLEQPFELDPPEGDRLFLYVTWTQADGEQVVRPIEDLIIDSRYGEPYPVRGFVYLGSRFEKVLQGDQWQEVFLADIEGNIATLYPTRAAVANSMIDIYVKDASAYTFADVRPELLPANGTLVKFLFTLEPLAGARPFEPEVDPVAIELSPALELARGSLNPYLQEAQEGWLERLGTRDHLELIRMAEQGSPELRLLAAALLGAARQASARRALYDALRWDREGDVRLSAAYALAEIGTRDCVEALIDGLAESWIGPREDAWIALQVLSGRDLGRDAAPWRRWLVEEYTPRQR